MYLAFKLAGPPCRRNTADCQLVGRFKTEKWLFYDVVAFSKLSRNVGIRCIHIWRSDETLYNAYQTIEA